MLMKIFFVNFLLYTRRGLASPITTLNPDEGSTDINIKQSPVTAPAPLSLVSSNDMSGGYSSYTTPTTYEIVEQELETELEMTTTSSNPTETTMPFTNPSPNQEEVLSELQDLWYYSEGLSDSQTELKSSISSIVHLAYIRVQTEPEETLDRLKYMLQKLKARLLISEESSAATTSHQDFDNQNTEIVFSDDSTTESSPSPTTADTGTKETRIHKRSPLIGVGEYENVFLSDNSAENSLFPILQVNTKEKTSTNKDKINPNTKAPTPTEATIQKIIHVKDRVPTPHKKNSTIKLPQIQVHSLDFTNSSSHVKTASIVSTTEIPSIMDTMMALDKKPMDTTNNSQDDENENSITADQIANAIFLLLNTGTKNASSSTQNLTVKKPIFIHNSDMPLVNDNENNDQVYPVDENNANHTELDPIHPITTLRPLPDYLNKFHLGLLSQGMPPKPIDKKTTILIKDKQPIENNSLSEEIMRNSTVNSEEIFTTPVSTKPQSPIIHIMAEISESNLILSPTTILNGTKEGIVQFVQTFNTLSFTAKMALLFVLSVSILSIALGIYSMGPPIIAVGVLGIVIPITLLLLLQTNLGKRRNKGKKEGMLIETAIQEFANEEFNQIIDLIFDAINKYAS